jgi:hypothetical protein
VSHRSLTASVASVIGPWNVTNSCARNAAPRCGNAVASGATAAILPPHASKSTPAVRGASAAAAAMLSIRSSVARTTAAPIAQSKKSDFASDPSRASLPPWSVRRHSSIE